MFRKALIVSLAGAGLLSAGASNAADLVTNGNFATGNLTGWTFAAAASGSDFRIGAANSGTGAGNAAWFGAISGYDDSISQTLSTITGTSYRVSFDLVMSTGSPGDFSASFGGTPLLSLTNPGDGQYHTYAFTETANSASTVLSFAGQNRPSWNGLTNVSVAAVPEPETYAMMIAGLGVLGAMVRRRRAKQS